MTAQRRQGIIYKDAEHLQEFYLQDRAQCNNNKLSGQRTAQSMRQS